jgi:cysteine desulfurase
MALFGCEAEVIFLSPLEHASVFYCRPNDKKFIEFGVLNSGLVDIADLEKKLQKLQHKNFLVTVCLANNETGAIQNVKEIAHLTHKFGGLIFSDVVQAGGKIKIDLANLDVDFASFSSHKMRGPQGVGALFVKKGVKINPLIHGSKQENCKRAGTHNIAGIAGFAEACGLIDVEKYAQINLLREHLEKSLKAIAGDDVIFFADTVDRLPNTSYIGLRVGDKKQQLEDFTRHKICISDVTGCSNGNNVGSNTLQAMKACEQYTQNTIRVSLGVENTRAEVDKFIEVWSNFFRAQNQ